MLREVFWRTFFKRERVVSCFKTSQVSDEDDKSSGQPIRELVHSDRQTIHGLADGYGVCQENLTENMNMHRVAVKFVP
jgi:hypothetical protein